MKPGYTTVLAEMGITEPFILAGYFREAEMVARVLEVASGGWVFLRTGRELRGTRGATVYYTDCWQDFAANDAREIMACVQATGARLIAVDCP